MDIQIGDYVRCDMPYNGQYWLRVDEFLDMNEQCYDVWQPGTCGIGGEVLLRKDGHWVPVYDEHLTFPLTDILEVRRMQGM